MDSVEEIDFDAISTRCEMKKIGMRHTKDGHVLALAINPDDTPHEILKDPLGQRYMVVLVRLNDHDEPVADKDTEEGVYAVKLAGTLCGSADFQSFMLFTNRAEELTEEATTIGLRQELGVKSRAELKTNRQARKRLFALRDEFMANFRGH